MANPILVLGSSNIDFILGLPRFPDPGETVQAHHFTIAFGGKGANQAVAAKRLGAEITFVTKLGKDFFGKSYRCYLIKKGLNEKFLLVERKVPTGVALIELGPKGENRIAVFGGANHHLLVKDLKRISNLWKTAKVFVSQLEIPIPTVIWGLKMAKICGALTLLNPSPPIPLSSEILSLVDYLVPNELEAQILSGIKFRKPCDLSMMAKTLLSMGTKNVIITLGSMGLFFKNNEEEFRIEAFRVKTVDTTAAGDAFVGGFAFGLAEGYPIYESLIIANAAGALATTRLGAQPSLPSKRKLISFLRQIDKNVNHLYNNNEFNQGGEL